MAGMSLRQLFANVLADATQDWDDPLDPSVEGYDGLVLADALLASPLSDIIDLAAVGLSNKNSYTDRLSPEVRALLDDWRANR